MALPSTAAQGPLSLDVQPQVVCSTWPRPFKLTDLDAAGVPNSAGFVAKEHQQLDKGTSRQKSSI